MVVKGIIYSVDIKNKIISIKDHNQVKFYYFQSKLFKTFRKYLVSGILISFQALDYPKVKNYVEANMILDIFELTVLGKRKRNLYSKDRIDESLLDFLKSLKVKMFIDTEMTLTYKKEESELIQAGLIMYKDNEEVLNENYYIRPTIAKFLNSRTKDFLHIKQSVIQKEGVSYYKFYNKFKSILNKYHPAVIIFGKNDKLFLERSYSLNKVPSLSRITRFVNILELIKIYYNLNNDPGLFNLYEKYYGDDLYQEHDALEDAYITMKVFNAFVRDIEQGGIYKSKIEELDK